MREKEVNISWKKIVANVKKYWWICVVSLVVALVLDIIYCIKAVPADNNAAVADSTKASATYYEADTLVYVEEDIDIEQLEKTGVYIGTPEINSYVSAIYCSGEIADKINESLAKNGMLKLTDTDYYWGSVSTDNLLIVSARCYNDYNKAEFISNELAKIIIDRYNNDFKIENIRIIEEGKAFKVNINSAGALERTFIRGQETSVDNDAGMVTGSTATYSKKELLKINIFTSKSFIIAIAGVLAGVIIIVILIIRDTTIYKKADIFNILGEEYLYMGNITCDNVNAVIETLNIRVAKSGIDKLGIVLAGAVSQDRADKFDKIISNVANADGRIYSDILTDAAEIKKLGSCNGLVLCIREGVDNQKVLIELMQCFKIMDVTVVGYMII